MHCRPLRIAMLVNQFPQLSETFIVDQITGLIDRGHSVDIYAWSPGMPTPRHAAVDRYDLLARTHYRDMPVRRGRRVRAALKLLATRLRHHPIAACRALSPRRYGLEAFCLSPLFWHACLVDKGPYDVIHGHFGRNGRLATRLRAAGLIQGAVVTTFHGYDVTRTLAQHGPSYYRHLFATGDLFLPVSEYLKRKLVEAGCPASRIVVHHMGIRRDEFPPHKWTPPGDRPVELLTIARLVEKKGVEYGIRAVASLRDALPRLHYRILGDGPLRAKLQALITQLGVGDHIELAGWCDRRTTLDALGQADLVLAPSVTAADGNQEGIPVVLMEALASGLPVISTRHSGIPELVEDGRSGLLVPERDVAALAAALERLLQAPAQWPVMGRHGRETVAAQFDAHRLDDQLVDIYGRLSSTPIRQPATAAPKRS